MGNYIGVRPDTGLRVLGSSHVYVRLQSPSIPVLSNKKSRYPILRANIVAGAWAERRAKVSPILRGAGGGATQMCPT